MSPHDRDAEPAVISLFGADFAGGSLVNLMLDSHPDIFGCGDVYKLFDGAKKASCSVCIQNCPIWNDEELKNELTLENVYAKVSERTGAAVLIDSSKTLRHFRTVFDRDPSKSTPVVLVKHPARLMGSFLANKYIPASIGISEYAEDGLRAGGKDEVLAAVDDYFLRIVKIYQGVDEFLNQFGMRAADHRLVYEDLIASPRQELGAVLQRVGLEWSDELPSFSDLEHHPIGGNAAAHYHLRRQPNPDLQNRREERMIEDKKAFYGDKGKALKVDDKYRSIVPAEWRSEIFQTASFLAACEELGYDPVSAD